MSSAAPYRLMCIFPSRVFVTWHVTHQDALAYARQHYPRLHYVIDTLW